MTRRERLGLTGAALAHQTLSAAPIPAAISKCATCSDAEVLANLKIMSDQLGGLNHACKDTDDPGYRMPRIVAELNLARPVDPAIIGSVQSIAGGEGPGIRGLRMSSPEFSSPASTPSTRSRRHRRGIQSARSQRLRPVHHV